MAEQFDEQATDCYTTPRSARPGWWPRTWAEFDAVPNVTLAIVLVGGALRGRHRRMTVGGLVAFVSLQLMLIWPIDALGWIIANGQEAMTAADRIYEVLDTEPSIVDEPAPGRWTADGTGRAALRGRRVPLPGSPTRRSCAASTSTSGAGETVAIVGVTGSGKTTLAVAGTPAASTSTAGRITLDGSDIRD